MSIYKRRHREKQKCECMLREFVISLCLIKQILDKIRIVFNLFTSFGGKKLTKQGHEMGVCFVFHFFPLNIRQNMNLVFTNEHQS
jgi:hypothetical protein